MSVLDPVVPNGRGATGALDVMVAVRVNTIRPAEVVLVRALGPVDVAIALPFSTAAPPIASRSLCLLLRVVVPVTHALIATAQQDGEREVQAKAKGATHLGIGHAQRRVSRDRSQPGTGCG
tara:strand:+ start:147 stop:509 length:363 start_codon:yes stop_codon:yes gene_type:complete